MKTLQQKIMRRIYFAYAKRVASNPTLLHGSLIFIMMIVLTYFVSIQAVIHNMSRVAVGDLGAWTYSAVTNTEAWTLLILGVIVFSVLSLRFNITSSVFESKTETA